MKGEELVGRGTATQNLVLGFAEYNVEWLAFGRLGIEWRINRGSLQEFLRGRREDLGKEGIYAVAYFAEMDE